MYRIMIVDDDVIITKLLEDLLTSIGYKVVESVSSGEEAVDMAKRLRPDIILMDIVMPGRLDGIEASEMIKAELDIPVIFLTAYTDDKFVKKAKTVEPFGYIVKPFQEKEIKAAIELALYKKDIERQLRESEERYRSVIDTAIESIITVDSRGNIASWNRAAETMFGYSADEVVDKPFTFILTKQLKKDLKNEMNRILSTGKSNIIGKTIEYYGIRKDGSEFPMEFCLTTWKTKEGIFFTIIVRDIAKRKRIEDEKEKLILELQESLTKIKALKGVLPICVFCKKIRNDNGHWQQIEVYIRDHSEVKFTHGLCPECAKEFYSEFYKNNE